MIAHIRFVSEGDSFGEMSLLEEMPRRVNAKTLEPTEMYLMYKAKFDDFLFAYPRIGIKIIKNIIKMLASKLQTQGEEQ